MASAIQTRRQLLAGLGSIASVGSAGLLAGCSGSAPTVPSATAALGPGLAPSTTGVPAQSVKVALLLPLTGGIQTSLIAKGLQQAAELSLFDRKIPGLDLMVRDDKGTPEGAVAAVNEAMAGGAELVLGPLLGPSVKAIGPLARRAGVPVIAFSNDPSAGGDGVHLLSFFSDAEARRLAQHALAEGRRSFAALIPEDTIGQDTEPAFRAALAAGGNRLALTERYPADMSGIMEPAERIMTAIRNSAETDGPIDTLFLPSSGDNVPRLVAMLRHHSFDPARVRLLVTSGWNNPAALRDSRVQGAWLAAPDPRGWNDLSERFGRAYNAMPHRLASLVYDAVSVASAFATQPKGQRFTAANLTRPAGFAGIDGPFRLLPSGGPAERSLAVLEVQSQGLVTVAPALPFGAAPHSPPSGVIGAAAVVRG